MTKEEVLKKIAELEYYINQLDEQDEIFLLSAEEYNKYKSLIPKFGCWWWLRPGYLSEYAAGVDYVGDVDSHGYYVDYIDGCVRPALRLKSSAHPIGSRLMKYAFPWIVIDSKLAIAEVPIATHRFDPESNDYQTSEIRQFLLDWIESRK